MKRKSKGSGFNPHQFQLDWTPATTATVSQPLPVTPAAESSQVTIAAETAAVTSDVPDVKPAPQPHSASPDLVQVLAWDFVTSFPEPMQDAIDAGIVSEEDAEPENVKAMHDELSRQLLGVLTEQDALANARRLGVDPKTKGKPTSPAGKQRLTRYFETEPGQLNRNWQALMGVYEAAFGEEAASAFDKAIRARHAGIPVVTQAQPDVASEKTADAAAIPPAVQDEPATTEDAEEFTARTGCSKGRRVIARLPVPRPLPHAIAAGQFGQDEHGPVNPSADEVREITLNHAEELIELLDDVREAQRRGLNEAGCKSRSDLVELAVQKYAEDFGEYAGQQLLAYCRRQLLINDASDAKAQGRRR